MDLNDSSEVMKKMKELLIFMDDSSDSEDLRHYSRMLKILSEENNKNNKNHKKKPKAPKPKNEVKHVGVQAVPEAVEKAHYSWLKEADSKISEFLVHLSTLESLMFHVRNKVLKKRKVALHLSLPKNTQTGKSYLSTVDSKHSDYAELPGGNREDLEDSFIKELIRERIESALGSAQELRHSIPVVDAERLDNFTVQECQVVETTVKETKTVRLERSRSTEYRTTGFPPLIHTMKRERTLPTVTESKFRHPSKMSRGTGPLGNKCCVPKTKKLSKGMSSAPATSPHPHSAEGSDAQQPEVDVPSRETGAIPKIRDARRVTSTVTRTQKTKKTSVKPLWR